MHVDPTQASTIESFRVDKAKHLNMVGDYNRWEGGEKGQNLSAPREEPTREFTDHEGMSQNLSVQEQLAEPRISVTQVVDPDRGVGQCHEAPERRRGIGRNLF